MTHTADSAVLLELDQAHVAQSPYPPPLVLEGGQGCVVWDVDGRRFLDFESGQFCMSTGHAHPQVAAAISAQAAQLMQIGNRFTSPVRIELAQRLAALSPDPLSVCLVGSTGSEANEIALRLAKRVTGRFELVALERVYHGRTLASFGISSSTRRMRRDYGPMAAGAVLIPTPYPYRCRFGCNGACNLASFEQAVETVDRGTSGAPAAVIVEFVLGAGGIIPIPANWAQALRDFCFERESLLIADEALTGAPAGGSHSNMRAWSPTWSSRRKPSAAEYRFQQSLPLPSLRGRRLRAASCRRLRIRVIHSSAPSRLQIWT